MIKIFSPTDNIFTSNGDKIIIPTKAKIHKEDNGAYYLDLETNLSYVNEIDSANGEDLADGLHPNVHGAKKMGTYNACEFKKFLDRVDMFNSND